MAQKSYYSHNLKKHININEIGDKQDYLNKNYPFKNVPKLTDKVFCLHCDTWITVGDFKVTIIGDEEYIICPNYPKCDGGVMDWMYEDYEGNINVNGELINVSKDGN